MILPVFRSCIFIGPQAAENEPISEQTDKRTRKHDRFRGDENGTVVVAQRREWTEYTERDGVRLISRVHIEDRTFVPRDIYPGGPQDFG